MHPPGRRETAPGPRGRRWLVRILVVIASLAVIWLFRGAICRWAVVYHPIGERHVPERTLKLAQTWFVESGGIFSDPDELADRALEFTDGRLVYRFSRTSNDPEQLLESHRAHCVGYSLFCASAIRTGLASSGLDRNWTVHARVAKLRVLGVDVHRYLPGTFFRDHDVVELRERSTGRTIWIDPSLHDFAGIDRIRVER